MPMPRRVGRLPRLAVPGIIAIDNAMKTVNEASGEFNAKNVDNPPLALTINGESLSFELPNFAAVQTAVELLDREAPCSFGLLSASAAENSYGCI
jgi:hypothetical protein